MSAVTVFSTCTVPCTACVPSFSPDYGIMYRQCTVCHSRYGTEPVNSWYGVPHTELLWYQPEDYGTVPYRMKMARVKNPSKTESQRVPRSSPRKGPSWQEETEVNTGPPAQEVQMTWGSPRPKEPEAFVPAACRGPEIETSTKKAGGSSRSASISPARSTSGVMFKTCASCRGGGGGLQQACSLR